MDPRVPPSYKRQIPRLTIKHVRNRCNRKEAQRLSDPHSEICVDLLIISNFNITIRSSDQLLSPFLSLLPSRTPSSSSIYDSTCSTIFRSLTNHP